MISELPRTGRCRSRRLVAFARWLLATLDWIVGHVPTCRAERTSLRISGFRSLAILAALVCFLLALVWGLAPDLLLALWGVPYSYPAGLVSRRGAALFLGVGVMF